MNVYRFLVTLILSIPILFIMIYPGKSKEYFRSYWIIDFIERLAVKIRPPVSRGVVYFIPKSFILLSRAGWLISSSFEAWVRLPPLFTNAFLIN